jgi:hypothetical protein
MFSCNTGCKIFSLPPHLGRLVTKKLQAVKRNWEGSQLVLESFSCELLLE